jgi:hypothetical protein
VKALYNRIGYTEAAIDGARLSLLDIFRQLIISLLGQGSFVIT